MGKIKRILASIMSLVLMIGLITNTNILSARAEGEQFTLEFNGATQNVNALTFTVDGKTWTVTIDGSLPDGSQWKTGGNNPELEKIPRDASITFVLSGDALNDGQTPKPQMNFAGDKMSFGDDNKLTKSFNNVSSSPVRVDLESSNNNNNNNNPGGDNKIIEFSGANISSEDGKATYQVGSGADAKSVTVEVVVNGTHQAISTGEHQEISFENSSTATLKFENFDTETMQVVLRGTNNYQQILAVSNGEASLAGINFPSPANVSVELKNTNNPPGPGGQNQGGQGNQGPGNQADVNLTVSWTGSFGEIKVGGTNGTGVTLANNSQHFGRVNITSDNKIEIILQAEPTIVFSSIKVAVDGNTAVEKLTSGQEVGLYSFTVPKETATLNIEAVTKQSNTFTIQWAYDNTFGPDALVEHGKVEMVAGAKDGANTYWQADAGSTITVKLIPDYGYQVVGAKINGVADLNAESNTNEFTFEMPNTHIHFRGIFTKTADVVSNSSTVASSASISNGAAVAGDGGTAKLSVNNATPETQADSIVKEEVDSTKDIKAVDIGVSQIFYKNRADSYWENTKSELSTPAQINLKVDNSAVDYAVVRTHGSEVTEIASSYNKATGTLAFASDKFSTYTLVPLTVSDEPAEETKPQNKPTEISGASRADEQFDQQVRTEELLDIQMVKTDKTQVEAAVDAFVPDKSYNMSAYKTARGFIAGLNKIAKNNRGAKSVSIYTGNPICFNKGIINALTKNKIDVVYYFMHKGHLYSVTIPAGTDLNRVLERNGFAGPLYVGKILGTSRLIK